MTARPHPAHTLGVKVADSNRDHELPAAFPEPPRRWLDRVRARRACRRAGGHWWHPADPMILWRCCACGHDRDGMPRNGT